MGNLYVAGPGGLWVISSTGQHPGTIVAPKHVHNMAWGDADGKTLYVTVKQKSTRQQEATQPDDVIRIAL